MSRTRYSEKLAEKFKIKSKNNKYNKKKLDEDKNIVKYRKFCFKCGYKDCSDEADSCPNCNYEKEFD